MKKLKKIAFIVMWVLLIGGLLFTMGFVNKEQDQMKCTALEVKVDQSDDLYFLDKLDVTALIRDRGDSIVGQPRATVNVPAIENALNSHADIANAEVYLGVDGTMKVEVKQRKPILRIFNADGESYYLDEAGKPMPLSDKYTAKVLVANGYMLEPYAKRYKYSVYDIAKDSLFRAGSMLDDLFVMANYINGNDFWKAQVQQIYVNKDRDLELVPTAGDQRIVFGDTSALEEKFNKLLTFYQHGLNITGWWDRYSTINLKFKNQIVCTKKS